NSIATCSRKRVSGRFCHRKNGRSDRRRENSAKSRSAARPPGYSAGVDSGPTGGRRSPSNSPCGSNPARGGLLEVRAIGRVAKSKGRARIELQRIHGNIRDDVAEVLVQEDIVRLHAGLDFMAAT